MEDRPGSVRLSASGPVALVPIFFVVAVDTLGTGLILPLLPFYARAFGATPLVIGMMISAYFFCQLIAGPILGALSDAIGKRRVLILSQFGSLAGFLCLLLAQSLPVLIVARVVDGLTAGNISVAQAYAADNSSQADRRQALATIGAAIGIGLIGGPIVSGFLTQFGMWTPVWFAVAFSATSLLATTLLLPSDAQECRPPEGRERKRLRDLLDVILDPHLRTTLVLLAVFYIVFAMFVSGFALFLAGRFLWDGRPFGPREVGAVFSFAGLISLSAQIGLSSRLDRFLSERRAIIVAFAVSGLGYMALGPTSNVVLLLLLLAVVNVGIAILRPTLLARLSQHSPQRHQGVIMGVSQLLMAAAGMIAPLASGFLIQHGHYAGWAFAIGLTAGLGAIVAACFLPREQRD